MSEHNPRGLKPRNRGQYSNEAYGRGGSSAPPDDLCINEKMGRTTVIRPKGKEGPLWFRPSPAIDEQDPTILVPGRSSTQPQGQSHWYVRTSVAAYIGMEGCPKYTFILCHPWEKERRWNGPYQTLQKVITERAKAAKYNTVRGGYQARWTILLPSVGGGQDKGPALPKPTSKGFMQASAVYINGKKDYTVGDRGIPLGMSRDDDPIVIEVSGAGGDQLLSLLDKRKDNAEVNEDRPWETFFYGDPTGLFNPETRTVEGGLILGFFNPKEYQSITKHTSWDGKIRTGSQSFEATVARSWRSPVSKQTHHASLDEEQTKRVFEKYMFWFASGEPGEPDFQDGILRVMPDEEQAEYVARAFQADPQLLEFAWAERPEFMTSIVKGILRKRRTESMPGSDEEYQDDGEQQAPPPRRAPQLDPTQRAARGTAAPAAAAGRRPAAPPPPTDEFGDEPAGDAGDADQQPDEFADAGQPEGDSPEIQPGEEAPPEDSMEGFDNVVAGDEGAVEEQGDEFVDGSTVAEAGDDPAEPAEPADPDDFPNEPAAEEPTGEELPAEGDPDVVAEGDQTADYFGEEAVGEPGAEGEGGDGETGGEAAAFEEEQLAEENTAVDEQVEGEDPGEQLSDAEQRMKESMEIAKQRASKRTSTQAAPPPAPPAPPAPKAAVSKPAPAPAGKAAPAAGKPAAATTAKSAPAAAATRPATAAPTAGKAAGSTPAAARTAPAGKPATAAPAKTAAPAAKTTAPAKTAAPAAKTAAPPAKTTAPAKTAAPAARTAAPAARTAAPAARTAAPAAKTAPAKTTAAPAKTTAPAAKAAPAKTTAAPAKTAARK